MADILTFPQTRDATLLHQALRLMTAFFSMDDALKRELVIEFVEGLASGGGPVAAVNQPSASHDEGPDLAPSVD